MRFLSFNMVRTLLLSDDAEARNRPDSVQ